MSTLTLCLQPGVPIELVSSARTCEVYSQQPGQSSPSYVGSIRGAHCGAAGQQFWTVAVETGGAGGMPLILRLRMLSLADKTCWVLQRLSQPHAGSQPDAAPARAEEAAAAAARGETSAAAVEPAAVPRLAASLAAMAPGVQEAATVFSGPPAAGPGSQMDEIQAMLQGVLAGSSQPSSQPPDPKRALMAGLAAAVLQQPPSGGRRGAPWSRLPEALPALLSGSAAGGTDVPQALQLQASQRAAAVGSSINQEGDALSQVLAILGQHTAAMEQRLAEMEQRLGSLEITCQQTQQMVASIAAARGVN